MQICIISCECVLALNNCSFFLGTVWWFQGNKEENSPTKQAVVGNAALIWTYLDILPAKWAHHMVFMWFERWSSIERQQTATKKEDLRTIGGRRTRSFQWNKKVARPVGHERPSEVGPDQRQIPCRSARDKPVVPFRPPSFGSVFFCFLKRAEGELSGSGSGEKMFFLFVFFTSWYAAYV